VRNENAQSLAPFTDELEEEGKKTIVVPNIFL
jgi:hypothetical protein